MSRQETVSVTTRGLTMLGIGLLTVALGVAVAPSLGRMQDPEDAAKKADPKAKAAAKPGGLRVPGAAGRRARRPVPDPLVNPNPDLNAAADNLANPNVPRVPIWPFHYTLKLAGADGQPIQAAYYPAKVPFQAPVVILLHETGRGRSGKDFEEPIEDLKGKSLVRYLQDQGYALLSLDLRGHGGNPRHPITPAEVPLLITDVEAGYLFLVDRHNRGELNLGKLGVIAVGEAANVAAAWAASPGAGISSDGRLSDIGAMILVSPVADAFGLQLAQALPAIATQFPILALGGDNDEKSEQPLLESGRVIERHRLGRVAFFDTTLHGLKLLNFFPKVATGAAAFLEDPVKGRALEWEPRFLLDPVASDGAQLVADSGFAGVGQPIGPAVAPPQPGPRPARKGAPAQPAPPAPPAANPVPKAVDRNR